jgi:flavin reductase (DIM6/NTAB) family NADH-FMN oxidoreductase RutF
MNAAWGGISEEKEITICVDSTHKTAKNFMKTGAFTVSMATADYVTECDYVGVVSANDVPDKVAKAGFTVERSEVVNAPIIKELPMTLECEMVSYDEGSCHLVGRIVNVSADESILTDGKIDYAKLRPITYDPVNHHYVELGAKIGNAFSDGKRLK